MTTTTPGNKLKDQKHVVSKVTDHMALANMEQACEIFDTEPYFDKISLTVCAKY
jgi:hypothetical protein